MSRNATSAAAAAATATVSVGGESRPLGDGSAGAAKNFVGVSQVFNSLNDYRNNVQSLATGMQAHESYNWETDAAQQREEQEPEQLDDEVEEQEVEEDDEEEELARHEDINKFSEAKSKDGNVSSTESLTTSSCSTFSSGPSPGNVSNSEEQEELSTPPQSDKPSALELPPKANSELDEQLEQQVAPAVVEDLATGLSSISITNTNTTESQSILPCEVTASSALGKVLNELSEETSTDLDTQSQARGAGGNVHILPVVSEENMGKFPILKQTYSGEPDKSSTRAANEAAGGTGAAAAIGAGAQT